MKRAEKNELSRIARTTGKCAACGEDAGKDKNGTGYVKCPNCRTRTHRLPTFTPPKRNLDPDYCFFDTKEWRRFCAEVYAAVPLKGSITVGGIMRALAHIDREFLERYVQTAIGDVIAVGKMRRCWGALPSRYERSEPAVLSKRQYNTPIEPPMPKLADTDLAFG